MLKFVEDKFDINEQPTIGVDFKVKHLEIDGQKIYLQIWVRAMSHFLCFSINTAEISQILSRHFRND